MWERHISVWGEEKKVEVRKKTLKWIGWLVEANHGGVSHWLDRLMHFSLICIIILIIRINTHSGRETQSSQRERGGTLEKQKAMCRKIMKGQPSTVSDVAVLVSSSSLQPANCYTKACRRISWNLLPVTLRQQWTTFGQRHCCGDILPTLFLQVFSQCSSACALTEEDSRAELSDILCGSVNVKGGA